MPDQQSLINDLNRAYGRITELKAILKEWQNAAPNVCQLLDAWRQSDPQEWTAWDQSVRDTVSNLSSASDALLKEGVENEEVRAEDRKRDLITFAITLATILAAVAASTPKPVPVRIIAAILTAIGMGLLYWRSKRSIQSDRPTKS